MQSTPMSAGTDSADQFLSARCVRHLYGVSVTTLRRGFKTTSSKLRPPLVDGPAWLAAVRCDSFSY